MARPRIVIVGAGFAGLLAAKGLRGADADVVVVDKSNHHLFQPLLYQVATAGLTPAEIATPIRAILRGSENIDVLMATVEGIDRDNKLVLLAEGNPLPYDYLVLATGATHSYFGHDGWERFAPGLKTIDDAIAIRRDILYAFERAENQAGEAGEWLTFVVIGGGPTGVEMAGAIAEIAKRTLVKDYEHIRPESAKILLLEGGPRLLAAFPENLGVEAARELEGLGVEIRLNAAVTQVEEHRVFAGGEWIRSRCIIWAAGVRASPVAAWLGVEGDRAGRIRVQPDLTVPGVSDVYVLGDLALMNPPLPGTAPAAMQHGKYVARFLRAKISGRSAIAPFKYFDKGNLATIGRSRAVGELRGLPLKGFIAWFVWAFVHILYLIGFRNRVFVLIRWAWSYFTWDRGSRLITGVGRPQPGEPVSRGR